MLISEKLNEVVSSIHNELTIALKQMASYVETVEQTTGLIPTGALEEIVNYSEVCQATAEELYKYKMFFDLSHIVDSTDNTIEELSDRY